MAYYIRAMAWLTLGEWENAKTDWITATDIGLDIIAVFHQEFGSIANFEQSSGIQLPADITDLLTPEK